MRREDANSGNAADAGEAAPRVEPDLRAGFSSVPSKRGQAARPEVALRLFRQGTRRISPRSAGRAREGASRAASMPARRPALASDAKT